MKREKKKYSNSKFEFVFKKNDNIICQRYFNVENYNEDILNSLEIKDLLDVLCGTNNGQFGGFGIIPKYLKDKSVDYTWNDYNPFSENRFEKNESLKTDDYFGFEIKVNKRTVAETIFHGDQFHPSVRYNINIKEIIPNIIDEIVEYFSKDEYTLCV